MVKRQAIIILSLISIFVLVVAAVFYSAFITKTPAGDTVGPMEINRKKTVASDDPKNKEFTEPKPAVQIAFTGVIETINIAGGQLTVDAGKKYTIGIREKTEIFKDNKKTAMDSLAVGDIASVIGRGASQESTEVTADSIYAAQIKDMPVLEGPKLLIK